MEKLSSSKLHFRLIIAYRVLLAFIIGYSSFSLAADPGFLWASDFVGNSVIKARELLSGQDPYDRVFNVNNVPYPLPAMLLGVPFAWMDDLTAGALFIGLSSGLLAFAITRDGKYWRLFAFLSYPYFECIKDVQYAPLVMSMVFYSDLLPLVLVKPQIAIAAAFWKRPTRRGILLTVGVLIISLLIYPLWPLRWLTSIGSFGGYVPVLLFGGPILLLSAFNLHKPAGRFLLAFSILPKRAFYDTFMLWLIPERWTEMVILTLISWLAFFFGAPDRWNWLMLIFCAALVFAMRTDKPVQNSMAL
jgi:hypothetical protein